MSILEDLKYNYNLNLTRYYNGCKYCSENRKELDKWLPELLEILQNMNVLLDEIMKYEEVDEQIIKGFKIEETNRK